MVSLSNHERAALRQAQGQLHTSHQSKLVELLEAKPGKTRACLADWPLPSGISGESGYFRLASNQAIALPQAS